MEKSLK
jgi:hypothetical protein